MADSDNPELRNTITSRRRRFLGLVGTGALPLLAGCIGGENESSSSGGSGFQKPGGHLRIGVSESPQSLNPLKYATAEAYVVGRWLYSNLTQLTPDLKAQPDLATDWNSNSDATTWTFKLRNDATFHYNGEKVTAKDVAATMNAIYSEEIASPGEGTLGPIESVSAASDYKVKFTLKRPFSALPKALTSPWARIIPQSIVKGGHIDKLANNDYGSGPFQLEKFTVGNQVIVSGYDDYYKTDKKGHTLPYLSKVSMKIQPEVITQITSLNNKEVDMLQRIPASKYSRVKNMGSVSALKRTGGWHFPIIMRTTESPFDDLRVRHAMKYAVDRSAILNGAQQGLGATAQDNPISPAHQFYTDLDDKYGPEAKVEKAKQLLNDAGYSNGLKLDFPLYVTPSHHPQMGPSSVLFQEQMKKIGIGFEIQNVPWSRFLSEIEAKAPFYLSAYGLRPLESQALSVMYKKDGIYQGSMWHKTHPKAYGEFIDGLKKAASTTDKEKKQKLYTNLQRITHDKGGVIVPFFAAALGAQHNYVRNYKLDPTFFRIPLKDVYLDSNAPAK